jgi:hypothetical protein
VANKKRICYDAAMSVRSCRVTIQKTDGIAHTAEVTASSLYEAVAQGLAALRKSEWVEGVEERFGMVKVSVAEVRVEHQVKIADFMKWLERLGALRTRSASGTISEQFSGCLRRDDVTLRPHVPSQQSEHPCPRVIRRTWSAEDDRFALHTAPVRGIGTQTEDHSVAES